MKIRLKINGIIMALALLLIAAFPRLFLRPAKAGLWDEIAEVIGITSLLLGQLLRTSARGYKSEHSQNGHSLIDGGPYNLVRNPMYLGILLIGLGIILMLFEWWAVGIFLAVFITRYIPLIFKEESKLSEAFPKDYPHYRRRVPRLFPRLEVLLKSNISDYLPLRLTWIKREIGTVLAVLFVVLLLESWEDIKSEGVKNYLKESIGMLVIILFFISVVIYLSRRTSGISKRDVADKS